MVAAVGTALGTITDFITAKKGNGQLPVERLREHVLHEGAYLGLARGVRLVPLCSLYDGDFQGEMFLVVDPKDATFRQMYVGGAEVYAMWELEDDMDAVTAIATFIAEELELPRKEALAEVRRAIGSIDLLLERKLARF